MKQLHVDQLIVVFLLVILAIVYLSLFIKVQTLFFNKKIVTKNNATTILFIASLLAAGIVLFDISKAITDAFNYYVQEKKYGDGIISISLYFIGAWIFSLSIFRLSFFIVSSFTKEDEIQELTKNNVELSLIHSFILIILSFIVAPALSDLAISFIPYPKMPF
jgi:hypothetical protein